MSGSQAGWRLFHTIAEDVWPPGADLLRLWEGTQDSGGWVVGQQHMPGREMVPAAPVHR